MVVRVIWSNASAPHSRDIAVCVAWLCMVPRQQQQQNHVHVTNLKSKKSIIFHVCLATWRPRNHTGFFFPSTAIIAHTRPEHAMSHCLIRLHSRSVGEPFCWLQQLCRTAGGVTGEPREGQKTRRCLPFYTTELLEKMMQFTTKIKL